MKLQPGFTRVKPRITKRDMASCYHPREGHFTREAISPRSLYLWHSFILEKLGIIAQVQCRLISECTREPQKFCFFNNGGSQFILNLNGIEVVQQFL